SAAAAAALTSKIVKRASFRGNGDMHRQLSAPAIFGSQGEKPYTRRRAAAPRRAACDEQGDDPTTDKHQSNRNFLHESLPHAFGLGCLASPKATPCILEAPAPPTNWSM